MARKPVNYTSGTEPVSFNAEHLEDACLRFASMLGGEAYLLAFADDGVFWGRVRRDELHTSHDVFPQISPPLQRDTLQQMHLFNPNGEIRVWRTPDGLKAVHIGDKVSEEPDVLDETYLLWGTHHISDKQGFTMVSEGSRGFTHAVPLVLDKSLFTNEKRHPLKLHVRHYLKYDDTGSAYIALTRLVDLEGGQV